MTIIHSHSSEHGGQHDNSLELGLIYMGGISIGSVLCISVVSRRDVHLHFPIIALLSTAKMGGDDARQTGLREPLKILDDETDSRSTIRLGFASKSFVVLCYFSQKPPALLPSSRFRQTPRFNVGPWYSPCRSLPPPNAAPPPTSPNPKASIALSCPNLSIERLGLGEVGGGADIDGGAIVDGGGAET